MSCTILLSWSRLKSLGSLKNNKMCCCNDENMKEQIYVSTSGSVQIVPGLPFLQELVQNFVQRNVMPEKVQKKQSRQSLQQHFDSITASPIKGHKGWDLASCRCKSQDTQGEHHIKVMTSRCWLHFLRNISDHPLGFCKVFTNGMMQQRCNRPAVDGPWTFKAAADLGSSWSMKS